MVTYFELLIASFIGVHLDTLVYVKMDIFDKIALISAKVFMGVALIIPLLVLLLIFKQIKLLKKQRTTVDPIEDLYSNSSEHL